MDATIHPGALGGSVRAVASKSVAHRVLICSALADEATTIHCDATSQDIVATIRCLEALGAKVTQGQGDILQVQPVADVAAGGPLELDCGESGSTMRFMLS